jgi:hypothetical protein
MHKNATKCNETLSKWCKNKHGASKIMDTLEMYQPPTGYLLPDDIEQAHIKMARQTDNEHLDISFIYHWYSFLL